MEIFEQLKFNHIEEINDCNICYNTNNNFSNVNNVFSYVVQNVLIIFILLMM